VTLATCAKGGPGFTKAILLIDPAFTALSDEYCDRLVDFYSKYCASKPTLAQIKAENPMWSPTDLFVEASDASMFDPSVVGAIFGANSGNRPWDFSHYLDELSYVNEIKVLAAGIIPDPETGFHELFPDQTGDKLSKRYSNFNWDKVPNTNHCIQNDAPAVVWTEALRLVEGWLTRKS